MIFFLTSAAVVCTFAFLMFIVLKTICIKEFMLLTGIQLVVAGIAAGICYWSSTHDTEILNSYVVDKKKIKVNCEHSYSCRCRESCTGSGKNRSCHQVCDTCYHHSHDWDWNAFTARGETFSISRVDWQGNFEPPRWSLIKIGEPTASTHSYENYVKAAPGTLFKREGTEVTGLPEYPQDIYDYYHVNRLVANDSIKVDRQAWNAELENINSILGEKKQANVVVVLERGKDRSWYTALQQAWIGGKKNDVIVVANLDQGNIPTWIEIMAWEDNSSLQVKLRDALVNENFSDHKRVLSVVSDNVLKYRVRKPMADFEYLMSSITPTVTQWIVGLLVQLVITAGLIFIAHREDIFGGHNRVYNHYNRNMNRFR